MDKQLLSKLLFWVMAAIGTAAIYLSAKRAKAKRDARRQSSKK
jgi:hypothetical protein